MKKKLLSRRLLSLLAALALVMVTASDALAGTVYAKVQGCIAIFCVSRTVDAQGVGHWGVGISVGPTTIVSGQAVVGAQTGNSVSGWQASGSAGVVMGGSVTAGSGGVGVEFGLVSPQLTVGVGYTW